MNINEIKTGMYLKSDFEGGEIVIVSEVFVEENVFSGLSLISLSFAPDFLPNLFYAVTFHEAFRDNVNRIVLEAIFDQNKDSLYDYTGRNSLAVSDMQKKWILKHYILKHEVDVNFAEYVKLKEAHSTLISEYKDLQNRATGFLSANKELTQKFIDLQKENQAFQEQNKKLTAENSELNHEVVKWKNSSKFEYEDSEYSRNRLDELCTENLSLKERIMKLTQRLIDQQREYDQRFCDLYNSKKLKVDKFEEAITVIGNLKKFIQHLQDYIAAKHLESEGLILEKYLKEEYTDNGKET